MSKEILINSTAQETRIALFQDKRIVEFFFERNADKGIVGNIYKGKVVRVLPGMQAAFVDIGQERAAFLYAGDFFDTRGASKPSRGRGKGRSSGGRGRRREGVRPIAELVKEGQEILVQVAKGPIGTKGARITCHLSLPGRFLVFMPSLRHNGVSRKIESYDLRRQLKRMIDSFHPKEGGFIVRTAASTNESMERQMRADVDYLTNLWKKISRKQQSHKAPYLLHYDLDLTSRTIRDHLDDDVDRLIVDHSVEHRRVLRFIRNFNPKLRDKVEFYKDPTPLFDRFQVEQEINRALGKRVWLKSGGYLIIETTEALTSIDVNTGRFVGKKTLEETILKTNLEAAEEIVRQLRLRNIGGIIIIDFIDMEREPSKEKVYRFLDSKLKDDQSKTTTLKISNLGLVEMTRKRTRESVYRYMTETCATCEGRGFLKSRVATAHQVIRDVRRELPTLMSDHLYITVHPEVYNYLSKEENKTLVQLEKQFQKGIRLSANSTYHLEQIDLRPEEPVQDEAPELEPLLPPQREAEAEVPFEEDAEDYSDADYQSDIEAIETSKTTPAADDESADEPELEEAPEIEAPLIRSKEEVSEAPDSDTEDDDDEELPEEQTSKEEIREEKPTEDEDTKENSEADQTPKESNS